MSRELVAMPKPFARRQARVLVLSRSPLMSAGLEHVITGSGFEIMPSGETHLVGRAEIVLIEADEQIEATMAVVDRIRSVHPSASIVTLGVNFDLDTLVSLRDAGVKGFCLSSMKPEILTKALEIVAVGGSFLPFELLGDLLKHRPASYPVAQGSAKCSTETHPSILKLSLREAEILRMIMGGVSNKFIARELALAEATVKVHMKAIMRKIGASNRTQAAMWANEHLTSHSPGKPLFGSFSQEHDLVR
ncbi:LuxR C-terminal-related transcriptional regulator [Microvirga pudoricolor]|uniref:LuxR C-terminal-related transcriptional regulator n=1 Tax=Microvirga pudoricolor TaxID=2778729 RepID=UPI00194E014D|nr:response regulator transcription factor [Microvirga pudoricolor]MBM6596397.1 response regulator transcription factor [Microvirga pudoricolor]